MRTFAALPGGLGQRETPVLAVHGGGGLGRREGDDAAPGEQGEGGGACRPAAAACARSWAGRIALRDPRLDKGASVTLHYAFR